MYSVHRDHHFVKFPPSCFYGKDGVVKATYGSDCPTLLQLMSPLRWLPGANGEASNDMTGAIFHEGPLFALLLLAILFQKYVLNHSNRTLGFCIFQALLIAVVGSALHSSFHVKHFELEKFDWYKELRTYHYIHHLGTTKHNYALMNIGLVDGVMNTLRLRDPLNNKNRDPLNNKNSYYDDDDEGEGEGEGSIELPESISWKQLEKMQNNFGSLTLKLLFSEDHGESNTRSVHHIVSKSRFFSIIGVKTTFIRVLMIGICFWFWFRGAHYLISLSTPQPARFSLQIDDFCHKITAPLLQILKENGYLQIIKNLQHFLTDCGVLYILTSSLLGESTVCVLGGLLALTARSILLFVTPVIPMSDQVELLDLTVIPKIFGGGEDYANSTYFVNLHVIVAVIVFQHKLNFGPKNLSTLCFIILAGLVVLLEILICLILRENWTFDVIVCISLASYCFTRATWISPAFDYVRSL